MTQTLQRPVGSRPRPVPAGRAEQIGSVWVRGGFAAVSSVAIAAASLVVVVLAFWAADSRSGSSAGAAIRTALQLWLAAHKVPMHVPGGTLALAPLGLTAGIVVLLARSAAVVARGSRCTSLRDLGPVVGSIVAPYSLLSVILAIAGSTGTVRPSPVAALLAGAVVSAGAAGVGAVRGAGLSRQLWELVPEPLRLPVRAAGLSLAVLLGAAVLALVAALVGHAGAEDRVLGRAGGVSAQLGIGLLCVLLLPNVAGWGMAYLAGPGFAVGAGTSWTVTGGHAGRLPALPLTAALPGGSALLLVLSVVVVTAAGAAAGALIVRQPSLTTRQRVEAAGLAGGFAALSSAVLALLTDGPAGPGAMAAVGPSPWQVGLVVGGEVAVVGLLVIAATMWVRLARELLAGR